MKQTKFTKSARGQECQIRIPLICNHDPDTTVLAHLNGGGMGMKHPDIHAAYACSNCHSVVDSVVPCTHYTEQEKKLMHLEGVIRTQALMIKNGVLVI